MKALAVVPARYGSVRFPGKPLARIAGRPLIHWVYDAASECSLFDRVIVATDTQDIAETVRAFGGEVELTSPGHRTGTDRVAEVAARHPDADVVANVQGDQPFVSRDQLGALIAPFLDGRSPEMATVACPLRGDPADPNVVKVVCDDEARALYFSRAAIPYSFEDDDEYLHHIGLYAFRPDFLQIYARLPETGLERRERLEQLRALASGYPIIVSRVEAPVLEVNTPEDLERAEASLRTRAQ